MLIVGVVVGGYPCVKATPLGKWGKKVLEMFTKNILVDKVEAICYNTDMKYPTVRTTLDKLGEIALPTPAIYILAYMNKIIYVGKAEDSVENRLLGHFTNALNPSEQLGKWLRRNADHSNIRLDVLVAPDDAPSNWAKEVEAKCIRQFHPLLNERLNHNATQG